MKYAQILREQAAKLEEEREAIKAEAEALGEAIVAEARSATPDEDTTLTDLAARSKALKDDIDAKLARAAELDVLAEERAAAPVSPTFIRPADRTEVDDVRSMNIRQITDTVVRGAEERGIDSSYAKVLLKRHASDLSWARGVAARSTDTYTSAFGKVISGREMFLTAEERAALAIGTNTAGGFLVPTHLDPTMILTNAGSSNAIRAISRVVTLTSGSSWNGITTAGSMFSWDGELAEVSDDSPNDFARPNVPVYKAGGFIMASVEALENIDGLASDVLMLFADGKDRLEGAAHATGSGSAPTGIFTALDANTNRELTSTTAATIGLVDLQAVKRSVGIRFRNNGTWVGNPLWLDLARSAATAVSGNYGTDLRGANVENILSRPVVETDDAPSTTTTTVRDNAIVYGDFSNYVIVDKPGGTSIQYIPTLFNTANNLPDGRSGWYMHFFNGADSVNDNAFTLLQDRTSA
jgi:HK97 family phage major capsid protein